MQTTNANFTPQEIKLDGRRQFGKFVKRMEGHGGYIVTRGMAEWKGEMYDAVRIQYSLTAMDMLKKIDKSESWRNEETDETIAVAVAGIAIGMPWGDVRFTHVTMRTVNVKTHEIADQTTTEYSPLFWRYAELLKSSSQLDSLAQRYDNQVKKALAQAQWDKDLEVAKQTEKLNDDSIWKLEKVKRFKNNPAKTPRDVRDKYDALVDEAVEQILDRITEKVGTYYRNDEGQMKIQQFQDVAEKFILSLVRDASWSYGIPAVMVPDVVKELSKFINSYL